MIRIFLFVLTIVFLSACKTGDNKTVNSLIDANFHFSEQQSNQMLSIINDSLGLLPRTVKNGKLHMVPHKDWTSGFFPGTLWFLYEYTKDEKWKKQATYFTKLVEKEKHNAVTHDMGFKLMCSYGNAYRLTKNAAYKEVLLTGAETLMTRFNPKVGCIRSWDHNKDKWDFPVIIDNMMNLELLYWAFRETHDSAYYKAANSHAKVTLKNHFREDYSSYHVVSYDTITGKVVKKNTFQGYNDESAWARGQAWGLYGYTMAYRESGDTSFLEQSKRIASYILNHKNYPADGVPYWDFNDPSIPNARRDASAAAIICSGLYELSLYVSGDEKEAYFNAADHILKSLSSNAYLASENKEFGFILEHSTGNLPKGSEIDKPIVYADYYFLEANLRRLKIKGNWEGPKANVIIKADDLTFDKKNTVHPMWQEFADFAVKNQIKVSAGIVGSSLERGNEEFFTWIKKYKQTGLFEFWNHGQLHKRWEIDGIQISEFLNQNKEKQMAYLEKTQSLAREKLGFDFIAFGAPYNWSDKQTALALEEFPEIKVWLYMPKNLTTSKIAVLREPMLNIEYPVHTPSFYHFVNSYYFYSNQKVIAIQGHPKSWDEYEMKQIKLFTEYFKSAGIKTILPADLLNE